MSNAPDSLRLNWMEAQAATLHCNYCDPAFTVTTYDSNCIESGYFHGGTVREAIDKAMAAPIAPQVTLDIGNPTE